MQAPSALMGLAPCWYVIPQDRPLAEVMYQAAVGMLGWNNPSFPVMRPPDLRFLTMGLVLAQELGDAVTSARLREKVEEWCEPRFFGSNDGEFGFWFELGEEFPRGQMSAFLMLGELVEEGSWQRVFNEPNLSKFGEPVVAGVDYPKMGLSRAFNEGGVLYFDTYAATASHRGQGTSFRVEQLPSASGVTVRRDGSTYERWRVTGHGVIEIDSEVGEHGFEVVTGELGSGNREHGGRELGTGKRNQGGSRRAVVAPVGPEVSAGAVRDAGLLLVSGAGTCPCCV